MTCHYSIGDCCCPRCEEADLRALVADHPKHAEYVRKRGLEVTAYNLNRIIRYTVECASCNCLEAIEDSEVIDDAVACFECAEKIHTLRAGQMARCA